MSIIATSGGSLPARTRYRHAWLRLVISGLAIAGPVVARAQSRGQPFNDSGIHSGPPPGAQLPKPKPVLAPVPIHPDPWQRLDRGAVLCDSEAALTEHQAAVGARLSGHDAAEPSGCQLVRQMTPVSVMTRHGPARTQVSFTNAGRQTSGWTDAAIPSQRPLGQ